MNNLVSGNLAGPDGDTLGGGLSVYSSTVMLNGNIISGNSARLGGGGLYLESSSVVFNRNTVIGNGAGVGGGLFLWSSDAKLDDNTISSNNAIAGGGLELYYGETVLSGNTISGNKASDNNSSGGAGGGLDLYFGNALLDKNTISGNTAVYGGGLNLDGTDARLDNNIISGNAATFGGGVQDWATTTYNGNIISNNTASWWGGGLRLGGNATFNGDIVISNTADVGSGIYVYVLGVPKLTNTLIADNRANIRGAALYTWAASPQLIHTTIARNTGGDGSGVYADNYYDDETGTWYFSNVVMTNTVLVSHTVGITVTAGSTITLEVTLWGSGAWANELDWGGAGIIITGTHNYWGDPAFVNPDAGDYHINVGSAAIDRGVNAGTPVDIDYEPRFGIPDLGADEYWAPGALKQVYLPLMFK